MSDDFARPNRNLDVSDFDHHNILERPSLALAGPGGSFAKKRRIVSTDGRSPSIRLAVDDDRLYCLEEKIKEQEHQQIEMDR